MDIDAGPTRRVSRGRRRSSSGAGQCKRLKVEEQLNTSDDLLATVDLETITTEALSQSQLNNISCASDTQVSFIHRTQLRDRQGTKFRCTPFAKLASHDVSMVTQVTQNTQEELLSVTQYKSYLHNESTLQLQTQAARSQNASRSSKSQSTTRKSQTNNGYVNGTQYSDTADSQIPATNVCNLTGMFVDSQQDGDDDVANTSGDVFEDNDCDNNDNNDKDDDLILGTQAFVPSQDRDLEVSTHTQGLTKRGEEKNVTKTPKKCSNLSKKSDNLEISGHTQSLRCSKPEKYKHLNKNIPLKTSSPKGRRKISSESDGKYGNERSKSTLKNSSIVVASDGKFIQSQALTIGDKQKSSHTSLLAQGNVDPKSSTTESLQEKIKKRLLENAGRRTPQGQGVMTEQLRARVLEHVHQETERLKQEGRDGDIGPFYGLPSKVQHMLENQRGISRLYAWQDECLNLPALKQRRNLIYSLPTSGGKTLVAEILILQELLCHKRDAMLVLPFVSIVQEKVRNLSQFAVDLNFYVEEYAGAKGRFPPIRRHNNSSLYIATIEKAQSIVNSLIETDRMDNLGLVVVDELHMLGEGGKRGSTLEATLMKILHAKGPAQIIGMSATLNNIGDLQKFLKAETYSNNFRPVELTEYVKLTECVYQVQPGKQRCPGDQFTLDRIVNFQYLPEMTQIDPDHMLGLALEVIPDNSCLIFCPTKKHCENVAQTLAKMLAKYRREMTSHRRTERKQLLKELFSDNEGKLCPVLQYTVHYGIAYHHSGLTVDERRLIEEAYSAGTLCLLACTSTLAAGVNLPAKRVILRSPFVGMNFLSRSQYKQMIGRAGRAGIDSTGESILICKPSEKDRVIELLGAPTDQCHSSLLFEEGRGLRALLLSTIGLQLTPSTDDVFKFIASSLAYCQQEVMQSDVLGMCREALQKLIDCDLVSQTKAQCEDPQNAGEVVHSLEVTKLGRATFKGPIDPDFAQMLYEDLQKAEESIVLSTHLHLLYLVTPYEIVKDFHVSWFIYFRQLSALTASELKVASLIGVPESYVARRASQQKCRVKVDEFVVSRFYLTLMLYDLWREKSIWEVAEKFQQPRGAVQTLLSAAASFASCVQHFCMELEEFWAYQDLLVKFVKRLSYCVTAELIPLMEIPGVKLGRARLMYEAGFSSLSSVANADPEDLVKAVQYMPRKIAGQIVASAKLLLGEKKDAMMEEVEALVTIPAGLADGVTMATATTPGPVTPAVGDELLMPTPSQ